MTKTVTLALAGTVAIFANAAQASDQFPFPLEYPPELSPKAIEEMNMILKGQGYNFDIAEWFENAFSSARGMVVNLGCNQGSISHGGLQEQAGMTMKCKCNGFTEGCEWIPVEE